MQHTDVSASIAEKPTERERSYGVCFDLDRLCIEGSYSDQLAAYRARRAWIRTFEQSFLLDFQHDFRIYVNSVVEQGVFVVRCEFTTACGRYAFWRITHNQAPEVNHLVQNAHIPRSAVSNFDSSGQISAFDISDVGRGVFASGGDRLDWIDHFKKMVSRLFFR